MNNRQFAALVASLIASTLFAVPQESSAQTVNPGQAAFQAFGCGACHAAGAGTTPDGANPLWAGNGTAANIMTSLVHIPQMTGLMASLTATDVANIASWLAATYPNPPTVPSQATFGATDWTAWCAPCHVAPTISNTTLAYRSSFQNIALSSYLATLDTYTLDAIALYMNGGSGPGTSPPPSATPRPSPTPSATPIPTQRPTATPRPTGRPSATPRPTPTPRPSPAFRPSDGPDR